MTGEQLQEIEQLEEQIIKANNLFKGSLLQAMDALELEQSLRTKVQQSSVSMARRGWGFDEARATEFAVALTTINTIMCHFTEIGTCTDQSAFWAHVKDVYGMSWPE